MGKTLAEVVQQLSTGKVVKKTVSEMTKEVEEVKPVPKIQLIYAFNGTGKTRLSREFKKLVPPNNHHNNEASRLDLYRKAILYYSAFTEDLFYGDNDLEDNVEHKLKIQPNSFTDWVLKDQGQDMNVITNFQRYTSDKLTPRFNEEKKDEKTGKIIKKAFSEVTFSLQRGDETHSGNLKLSKGEESNFIWSIFYTLLEQVIFVLNISDPNARENTDFNDLQYVFIDDPVSSLDENHLIQLAVDLASLIKSSQSDLKFIISTHSPLFYNVLFNELNNKTCYMLERFEDGSFALTEKYGDSNQSFTYHLHLKQTIEKAITENRVERFHFSMLRNLYEKTASFLGYSKWSELLPDDKQLYLSRILNFTSHSTLSNEAVAEPTPAEKAMVKFLLNHLTKNHNFGRK